MTTVSRETEDLARRIAKLAMNIQSLNMQTHQARISMKHLKLTEQSALGVLEKQAKLEKQRAIEANESAGSNVNKGIAGAALLGSSPVKKGLSFAMDLAQGDSGAWLDAASIFAYDSVKDLSSNIERKDYLDQEVRKLSAGGITLNEADYSTLYKDSVQRFEQGRENEKLMEDEYGRPDVVNIVKDTFTPQWDMFPKSVKSMYDEVSKIRLSLVPKPGFQKLTE